MLQKLFFLVSLLGLNHAGWYTNDNGYTIGICIALAIAFVANIIFYYVWGNFKSADLNNGKYVLMGIIATAVTLGVVFFAARKLLVDYVVASDLTSIDPSILSQIKNGTFDMWLFAINSAIWCAVAYFIFSIMLKRWSHYSSIPFEINKRVKKVN